jgi:catechol 2,3-dioxygenase-like lactoylglutathione lyase family enzyme
MAATKIVGVATVSVPVSDQERALKFYTETLGFETRRDAEFGGGMRWIEVGPSDSTTTIALPPLGPESKPGVDTGIRLITENAEDDHEALRARGVDADDVLRFPNVPPMFSFRDPDGNTLYVVERG